jgi:hypothetical protein
MHDANMRAAPEPFMPVKEATISGWVIPMGWAWPTPLPLLFLLFVSNPVQLRSQPATLAHRQPSAITCRAGGPQHGKSPNVIQEGQWKGVKNTLVPIAQRYFNSSKCVVEMSRELVVGGRARKTTCGRATNGV